MGKLVMDERKMKILHAVIETYLETGEPVGSRTISRRPEVSLSSATIRNEMADLEDMGYILQPHTSAGRIPSDKGYRLYVDMLMEERAAELQEKEAGMLKKAGKMDQLLKQAAKLLAETTNYASLVSAPCYYQNQIKFIQLSKVDATQLVAVIVMEGNIIKNRLIEVEREISNEMLFKLNMLLNTGLNGLPVEKITLGLIAGLKEQAGIHSPVIGQVLDAVVEAISAEDDYEVYTSGATNIFKYPELSERECAEEILNAFEEKQHLAELINRTLEEEEDATGIQVYIGDETPGDNMKDCSIVTATYALGEGMQGTIGIIGPRRMDYEKVLKSLSLLRRELDAIFRGE